LCFSPELASRRTGVAFALHGQEVERAVTRLRRVA
ncbi:hypothetical protein LCGC14_2234620, partial [marine sediment metagenome]